MNIVQSYETTSILSHHFAKIIVKERADGQWVFRKNVEAPEKVGTTAVHSPTYYLENVEGSLIVYADNKKYANFAFDNE